MYSVLVTGGAGYIGSFMVQRLLKDKIDVTVIDNLERGSRSRLPDTVGFAQGSLLDKGFLHEIFQKKFNAVIHFAAYISVKESTQNPGMYFENNVQATVNLLEAMIPSGTHSIVFSSSAAVYGNPETVPIPETHQKNPESPYGESKWLVERILHWYAKTKQINSVSLRYFNASGAALDGSLGESHEPETHIIPCSITALLNQRAFTLFGSDYDTKDGTCVRDYIHVLDLVDAHVLALRKIEEDTGAFAYNVGTGEGYSNKEIIAMIEEVSGRELLVETAPRRAGDSSSLIADSTLIQKELNFHPDHSDLKTIISSAWKWHTRKE